MIVADALVRVEVDPLGPDLAELQAEWERLDARADQSFFLSWGWIGPWVASLPASCEPHRLTALVDGEVVGLALAVATTVRRRGVIRSRTVALNTSGHPALDIVALEYNDFLVDATLEPSVRNAVRRALSEALFERCGDWDEVGIPYAAHPYPRPAREAGVRVRSSEHTSPFVDLDQVRDRGGLLPLLSSNRRGQVRRARRDLETLGPITLAVAGDRHAAHEALDSLSRLHQRHWESRGHDGAFGSGYATELHRAIIDRGVADGQVQLTTVRAGGTLVGHSYNFVHHGRVLNYQNGFDFTLLDGKVTPGYVCHLLAIEHNAELGARSYDFLAGDEGYKKRLATGESPMTSVVYQRPRLRFTAEDRLRDLKHWLAQRRRSEDPATGT